MIPRWFLYLQGFAMLTMGVAQLFLRPRQKPDDLAIKRFVNVGTLWAVLCCGVGIVLLLMALGYWSWPSLLQRRS